jgi:carboxylesterase type B
VFFLFEYSSYILLGDQEDEGTLFSLFQSNTTTTSALIDYLHNIFFHDATRDQVAALVATYDNDVTAGSPFRTGIFNEVYPGFKRLSAILGDLVFTLTRRAFLTGHVAVNGQVPAWSYISSYDYLTPILGTFHGSDLLQVFYGILPNYASKSIQSYYANFVYNLDPNDASGGTSANSKVAMNWPQWETSNQLMQFYNIGATLLKDDFRSTSFNWIIGNIPSLRI